MTYSRTQYVVVPSHHHHHHFVDSCQPVICTMLHAFEILQANLALVASLGHNHGVFDAAEDSKSQGLEHNHRDSNSQGHAHDGSLESVMFGSTRLACEKGGSDKASFAAEVSCPLKDYNSQKPDQLQCDRSACDILVFKDLALSDESNYGEKSAETSHALKDFNSKNWKTMPGVFKNTVRTLPEPATT
eukprot:6904117-Karenia_brevis.AAC.1